jgi:hypothetical protein
MHRNAEAERRRATTWRKRGGLGREPERGRARETERARERLKERGTERDHKREAVAPVRDRAGTSAWRIGRTVLGGSAGLICTNISKPASGSAANIHLH